MSSTPRQEHIVQVIRDFSKCGYSPALMEIGAAVGIGTVYGVRYQIAALQKKRLLAAKAEKAGAFHCADRAWALCTA